MIPELGHRTAPNPASTSRSRLEAPDPRPTRSREAARGPARSEPDFEPADPADDPGADFSLSLSSASLRLSEARRSADQATTGATSVAARAPAEPAPALPASSSPVPAAPSAPASSPAAPNEDHRRGPSSRAIEAYREIARAPVGERIRIRA